MQIAVLTRDLFFTSKIEAAARQAGQNMKTLPDTASVLDHVETENPSVILLDLTCHDLRPDPTDTVQKIRAAGFTGQLVAYGPHIGEAQLEKARQAGCDQVLSRGQLHGQLKSFFSNGGQGGTLSPH